MKRTLTEGILIWLGIFFFTGIAFVLPQPIPNIAAVVILVVAGFGVVELIRDHDKFF